MSRLQSTRRLSLLAGSSHLLASLIAAGAVSATLAPKAALADNDCPPANIGTGAAPASNGADPDTYACSGATTYQVSGITYDSQGNLTVNSTGAMNVGTAGVELNGAGADTVTWTSTGTITGADAIVIDITSDSGLIDIDTAGVSASGTATGAIRAFSDQRGPISITSTSTVTANGTSATTAIDARSTGVSGGSGAVDITVAGVTGRLRGIYAQSSGTGALTITGINNGVIATNTGVSGGGVGQVAGIEAVSGTGLLTIDMTGGGVNARGANASAIRTNAGGDTHVVVGAGRSIMSGLGAISGGDNYNATPNRWVMELNSAPGALVTIDNAGSIKSNLSTIFDYTTGADDRAIQVVGGRVVINNTGLIAGRLDFSAVTGNVVFNQTGTSASTWRSGGDSRFSDGDDTINIAAGSFIQTSFAMADPTPAPTNPGYTPGNTTLQFGQGLDTINNNGTLYLGGSSSAATLTLAGLEVFNNAGLIVVGANDVTLSPAGDGFGNDRLSMPGTAFTGSGASRIALAVNLSLFQSNCEAAIAGDCVDLTGGTTAGRTLLTIQDKTPNNLFSGYLSPAEGIVLIDVAGGVSAAEHFAIDPNSDGYVDSEMSEANLGLLKRGYFLYDLAYDTETQQHKIVSVPDTELMEFTLFPQMVQGMWQTSTTGWFDRQADVRGGEAGSGVWLRVTGEESERDAIQGFNHEAGTVVSFDNSYGQKTVSVTGGVDLLRAETPDTSYAFGAMLGYVNSRIDFENSATSAKYKGGTLGLYGSYSMGRFFLDGAINGIALVTNVEAPAAGFPAGLTTNPKIRGVGGQIEGGWRGDFGVIYVEPLVSLSYMSTRFDRLALGQVKVDYEDPTTFRGGVGLRMGADAGFARFSLTGRWWNEFEGENRLIIDNDAADLPLADDFSGSFGEVSGQVSVNSGMGLASFAGGGVKFSDDYQAVNASVGLTYRW